MEIDYLPFTNSDLASSHWDLIVADVTRIGSAFFNTDDGQRPPLPNRSLGSADPVPDPELMIFTPVDVEIDRSLKGSLVPGPSEVLTAGGVVGCYVWRVDPSPVVEVGSRYVLILATAVDSSGTNVLRYKEAKFAWPLDDDGIVRTFDGPMSIDELAEIVSGTPRLVLGDAHNVSNATRDDTWLIVHVVGAMILRLVTSPRPSSS